ncbi:hypothetical protein DC3_24860 [Deinococcus cellulosilyticus NBRC 106333 = KACC 11606]|uniref:Uncharacterized protein n=2 Tax=Deinococcus cellulosilyticus TaxID=401558 RepID=A0A511N367_DEIC1|nr:hypothetical protein DC3_24860 [Deinococcus cellulosilyticus NBRC 106333 = KACC 11606]
MLLIGLLSLGLAVAQGTPQNYENIGSRTLSHYTLTGKVKQVKECMEYWGCEVMSFNEYGIETKYLKSRKFIKDEQGILIFETTSGPEYSPNLKEYFQDGHLLRTEGIDVANPGQTYVNDYVYSGDLLKSVDYKISSKEGERVLRSDIMVYTNGILNMIETSAEDGSKGRLIIDQGRFLTKKFDFRYPNPIETYTYTFDDKGNWIKQIIDGELEITREITYY